MKKLFVFILVIGFIKSVAGQNEGYCKFMRLAFACADTNFALFEDPDNPFSVKPSVLERGGFTSGELTGLQHMILELAPSDASHYPEAVRDSMMIATFNAIVEGLHANCYPELSMSMDMIKSNGAKTVFEKEQTISKYLFYFKEIDSGMNFPLVEGLESTQHLQVSLNQDLTNKSLYHIEYLFVTAQGFKIMESL